MGLAAHPGDLARGFPARIPLFLRGPSPLPDASTALTGPPYVWYRKYNKLQTFLYLPGSGIVQGMRPLIGYNYGAGEFGRVRKIYRLTLWLCGGILGLGTLLCFAFSDPLIGLFAKTPETLTVGRQALRIISCGFLVSAVSVATSGALEGLGKGVASLIISLFRYCLIIMPLAWLLCRAMGPTGVWHAFRVTEVIAAAVSVAVYRKSVKLS